MLKSKEVSNKQVIYFVDIYGIIDSIDEKFIAAGEIGVGPVVYKGVVNKNRKSHKPNYVAFGDNKIRFSVISECLFKTLNDAMAFVVEGVQYNDSKTETETETENCNCDNDLVKCHVFNYVSLIFESDSYEEFMYGMLDLSDHAISCESEVLVSISNENSGSDGYSWYVFNEKGDIIGEGYTKEEALSSSKEGIVILSREIIEKENENMSDMHDKSENDSISEAIRYFCEL